MFVFLLFSLLALRSDWNTRVIDCTIPVSASANDFVDNLTRICEEAAEAIQGQYGVQGCQAIILSDRMASSDRIPIPSLLAVGSIHQHLLMTKQRPKAAIFIECGDAKEVHDFATLLGFGADGICPYLAYECLAHMNSSGIVKSRANADYSNDELFYSYRKAIAKGILKGM
jgi:glutamate synthase (NADPH/NADH)